MKCRLEHVVFGQQRRRKTTSCGFLLLHEAMLIRQSRLSWFRAAGAPGRRTLRSSVDKRGMMRPRQFVTLVALCGTVALAAWGTARSGFGSSAVENTATADHGRGCDRGAISLSAEIGPLDAPPATTMASLSQAATSDPELDRTCRHRHGRPRCFRERGVSTPRRIAGGCTGLSRRSGDTRSGHDRDLPSPSRTLPLPRRPLSRPLCLTLVRHSRRKNPYSSRRRPRLMG